MRHTSESAEEHLHNSTRSAGNETQQTAEKKSGLVGLRASTVAADQKTQNDDVNELNSSLTKVITDNTDHGVGKSRILPESGSNIKGDSAQNHGRVQNRQGVEQNEMSKEEIIGLMSAGNITAAAKGTGNSTAQSSGKVSQEGDAAVDNIDENTAGRGTSPVEGPAVARRSCANATGTADTSISKGGAEKAASRLADRDHDGFQIGDSNSSLEAREKKGIDPSFTLRAGSAAVPSVAAQADSPSLGVDRRGTAPDSEAEANHPADEQAASEFPGGGLEQEKSKPRSSQSTEGPVGITANITRLAVSGTQAVMEGISRFFGVLPRAASSGGDGNSSGVQEPDAAAGFGADGGASEQPRAEAEFAGPGNAPGDSPFTPPSNPEAPPPTGGSATPAVRKQDSDSTPGALRVSPPALLGSESAENGSNLGRVKADRNSTHSEPGGVGCGESGRLFGSTSAPERALDVNRALEVSGMRPVPDETPSSMPFLHGTDSSEVSTSVAVNASKAVSGGGISSVAEAKETWVDGSARFSAQESQKGKRRM